MARLKWLLIPVFAIFLMSHNVSAAVISSEVKLINGNFRSQLMTTSWNDYNANCPPASGVWVDQIACNAAGLRLYDLYVSIPRLNYQSGDWVVITLNMRSGSSNTSNHILMDAISYGGSNPIELVYTEYQQFNANSMQLKLFMRAYGSFTDSNIRFVGSNGSYGLFDLVGSNDQSSAVIRPYPTSVWRETQSADYSQSINGINNSINNLDNSVNDLNDSIKSQNEKENNAVDSIDSQSADDIDAGDNSSATSLIGNVKNIFDGISSAPVGSSCNVPADWGNLNIGNLNLCTGKDKLPWVVTFAAYVFELVFVTGCAIILVKQVLSLYDWSRR